MAETQKRREFLKTSLLAGMGVAFVGTLPSHDAMAAVKPAAFYGYGGLSTIAITDDCARLIRHASGTSEAFRKALESNVDLELPGNVALTACVADASKEEIVRLLQRCRERWPQHGEEEMTRNKLGFALGWLTHRAARQQLEPLYEASDASSSYPSEMSTYHDAAVLRGRSPKSTGERADGDAEQETEAIEQLFQEMGIRILIRFHTFVPDYDDIEGWISRLALWRGEKEERFRRLARAYHTPDSEKQQRYVTKPNFYDESDEIIRMARALQEKENLSLDIEEAIESAATQSHYAQALRRGCRNLQAADDYFRAAVEENALMERIQ